MQYAYYLWIPADLLNVYISPTSYVYICIYKSSINAIEFYGDENTHVASRTPNTSPHAHNDRVAVYIWA